MYTNTVQSLNNIDWKLFELQITLSKYKKILRILTVKERHRKNIYTTQKTLTYAFHYWGGLCPRGFCPRPFLTINRCDVETCKIIINI
jgi:hypothetical protein